MFDRRAATLLLMLLGNPAHATELIALTDRGTLLTFSSDRPTEATALAMAPCSGQLLGIDRRPADQKIYGSTSAPTLVRSSVPSPSPLAAAAAAGWISPRNSTVYGV